MRKPVATLLTIALCVVAIAGYSKNSSQERRAKARYFYLRGAEEEANDNTDAAYELYKKAYNTDPNYAEAAFSYGLLRLNLPLDTFNSDAEKLRSLAMMKAVTDEFPEDLNSLEIYAYTAMGLDRIDEALSMIDRVKAKHPGLSRIYLPLSYIYAQKQMPDSALSVLQQLERLEGKDAELTQRKAVMHLLKNDTIGALAEFDALAEAYPDVAEYTIQQAAAYTTFGQLDKAMEILKEGNRRYPDNLELSYNMALTALQAKDTTSFHSIVREAFFADSVDLDDRLNLLFHYTLKIPDVKTRHSESDSIFEDAEKLYGDNADFIHLYATYEAGKGNYHEAAEKLKRLAELDPTDTSIPQSLMTYYIRDDKPEEAVKVYEEAVDSGWQPTNASLFTYFSAVAFTYDLDKALAVGDSVLTAFTPGISMADSCIPDSIAGSFSQSARKISSSVFEMMADIYNKIGRSDDVALCYEKALALFPDNPMVLNNYAYYIVDNIKADPSSSEFKRAKEMSHKSIVLTEEAPVDIYYDTYAWILFREGNYKDAATYQEVAVELEDPDEPSAEIHEHYGDILFMNDKPEEALAEWEKAFGIDDDNNLLEKKIKHKNYFDE